MGQYYRAVVIRDLTLPKKNKYDVRIPPRTSSYALNPFDYDNLQKLTEFSYLGNTFADTITNQFVRSIHDRKHKLLALVGDYSEKNDQKVPESLEEDYRYEIATVHDAVWNEYGFKSLRKKGLKTLDVDADKLTVINRTLREYVVLSKCPEADPEWDANLRFNPLMILCATSNGLGGGDYHGNNKGLAGRWAWCDIVVDIDPWLPEDYTELVPDFQEE